MRIDRLRLLLVLPFVLVVLGLASTTAHAQAGCPNATKQRVQYPVKIDSAPPGATIYLDGKHCPPLGQTPWTGKLNPGTITVILEATGYVETIKTFSVAKVRKTQELFVPLTRRPQIEVRADADKNLVGATVSVDGVPQGQVQGPLVISTSAARHLVEIKKDGYETFSTWVDLTTTPSVVLTPALREIKRYGSVLVETDVPGAEVYVDQNKHPDTTPTTITNLTEGVHVIEVRKDGQTASRPVTIKANGQEKVRLELLAGVGVVRVMSETPGARAFIDGIDKGPVPVDIKDIKAGEHIIQIKAPGFKVHEEIVAVTPGSSRVVNKTLEADVPADSGTLKVVTTQPEAEVFIDGVAVGKAQEIRKPAGEYLVVVKLPGFKQFEQTVKVDPGKMTTVTADLKSVGKLRILSNPPGASVMINGFVVGKTPLETDVETGDTILRLEMPGFNAFEETLRVDGGDKTQTISRELAVAGKSEAELELEQKGLSSFGARTLPRGRSTVDIDAGYPYFAGARITVGAGRLAKRFGFDATVAFRTMLARTELGLGGRVMLSNAEPFSAGVFSNIWYGSKLFDDSFRSGFTWDAGGIVSLSALSNITISGRGYFQVWSDRHCPPLANTDNGFEGTDPTDMCIGYKQRVLDGMDPMSFSEQDARRVEKLTGRTGRDVIEKRENGVRFLVSLMAEIAVDQRWSVFGIFEGTPFQGRRERALFTEMFSGTMPEKDALFYGRVGLTHKF
jgi:hypothetical protein